MDINHIELSPALVVDLYKNSLVEAPGNINKEKLHTEKQPKKYAGQAGDTPEPQAWKSLGSNAKNILIIVNNAVAVHLTDVELQFLTGILGACKLSLADVAVLNIHHYPGACYKELTAFFKSKIVLMFDVDPVSFSLPLSFPQYQLQAFAGNTFLYAPSLKQLENNKVEKSKLWVCLKRLFNL